MAHQEGTLETQSSAAQQKRRSDSITPLAALAAVTVSTLAALGSLSGPANAAPAASTANVMVVHAAPFSNTLAGTNVTVTVDSTVLVSNVVFGQHTNYLSITAGTSATVEVFPEGSVTAAMSAVVSLTAGADYTVLAIGDGVKQPLQLMPLLDDNAPITGVAKVRVVHAAPLSNTITGTLVDVRTQAGTPVTINFPYKGVAGYVPLPAGPYDFKVTLPGGAVTAIDPPAFAAAGGSVLTLVAIGDIANQPLAVLPIGPFSPLGNASVQLVHAAPFSNTLAGTAVSITLNSALGSSTPLTNFVFGQTTGGYISLTANLPTTVTVTPAGALVPAITTSVVLSPNVSYTFAAIGDGVKQTLEILALIDDTVPSTTTAKIRVVHAAPISNTIAGTLVDLRTQSNLPVTTNFAYKTNTGYLPLSPGLYDLKVTLPNTGPTAIDLPPFNAVAGQIATVFAVGDISNQPLGIIALGQLNQVPEAKIWLVHAAPFSNTAAGTAVTVTVETPLGVAHVLTDVRYGQGTGAYLPVYAGLPVTISVSAGGVTTPVLTSTTTLITNTAYTIAAIGNISKQPLELLTLVDDTTPLSGSAKLRIVHAAPFTSTLSATSVDIRTQAGTLITAGLLYKGNTGYLVLPAGVADVKVLLGGTGVVLIDPPPALLGSNSIQTVFAIGDGAFGNSPLSTLTQLTTGKIYTVRLPLLALRFPPTRQAAQR
jgi:hypothetical protein